MSSSLLPLRARKRISLTALIDVVFILLMFFMLTSTFSKWSAVPLKAATTGGESVANVEPQMLIMHDVNSFSIRGSESKAQLPLSELVSQLDTSRSLLLVPVSGIAVDALVRTLETLNEAGHESVQLGQLVK
ncbi:ExbD/TolR family protein [Allohahella sp. A8]|uniref:ExbD/TolR family protein n=1 Tax=Allohahella sp. A8 TaxID=3141461 RepID=UPI000C0AC7C0|nr:biopolymer transporter ExbD [Hahellaceae bacterium]|tara:strand:+ start:47940 stop:48335 length:396 start_codon:yes stop_codon:yes gene_type:complete